MAKEGNENNSDSWRLSALLPKLLSFNSPCKIKHPQTPLLWSLPWFKELQWIFFTVKSTEKLSARHSGLLISSFSSGWPSAFLLLPQNTHTHTHTHTQFVLLYNQGYRNNSDFGVTPLTLILCFLLAACVSCKTLASSSALTGSKNNNTYHIETLLSELSCLSIFPPMGCLLRHSVFSSCLLSTCAPALWFFHPHLDFMVS